MTTRNSIKRMDMGYGRSMMAFRVFPPFASAFSDTPLGKAALGRDIVTDHERLEALIDAIDAASTEELEMARPVLHFHIEELKDFLRDTSWQVRDVLKLDKGPAAMIEGILDGVSKDVREAISAVDRAPRHRKHQQVVRGTMDYLAEVLAFANAAAPACGAGFDKITKKASATYIKCAKDIRKMATELEGRYEGVTERLGDPDAMLREADTHVREVDMTIPDISAQTLERVLAVLGDRDRLWHVYNSDERLKDALEKGHHRVYSDFDAVELRRLVGKVFREVNRSYNTGGIAAELMMATSAIRYSATNYINTADKHTAQAVRMTRKVQYESEKEREERIEKRIGEVPGDRFFSRSEAAACMVKASMMGDLLNDVHASLHPEKPVSRVSFERFAEGILVGELPGLKDAIVIARDRSVGEQDGVYLARVPHSKIVEGFDCQRAKEFDGTNFYSADDALRDLGSELVRTMFFDGLPINGHNGFEILAQERTAIRKKLADGASITDFAEYDGRSALFMA
jgi:hypothetical protein